MSFLSNIFGKKPRQQQISYYNPQQNTALDQLLSGASGQLPQVFDYLQNMLSGSPEAMEAFQAPALRQFNEQIVPTLAEKFSQLGAQKSNAFGQQLGQAGASLAENLNAQRAGLQQNAVQTLLQLLQGGLQQRGENVRFGGTPGLLSNLLGGLSGGLPNLIGFLGQGGRRLF